MPPFQCLRSAYTTNGIATETTQQMIKVDEKSRVDLR